MKIKVGIPRALLYHKYAPAWEKFFRLVGADIVISPQTSKKMLQEGSRLAENEICVPLKVFYGHIADLSKKADYLFVPRIVSVEKKAYTCPKFLGLPDLAAAVKGLPPLISPTINLKMGRRHYWKEVLETGRLFTRNDWQIVEAYAKALRSLKRHEKELYAEADNLAPRKDQLVIGVAGHPYNLHDAHISLNLLKRLREAGVQAITSEMVSPQKVRKETKRLPKELFWSYEKEVVGAVGHWMSTRLVDGIIYLIAFPCGPDSIIQTLIEKQARREGLPLMPLVIDEHSGEAGMITRLEAFLDQLAARKAVLT